jgi:hypothetical protein
VIRTLVCAVAIVALWLCALGWVCELDWRTPWLPGSRVDLPARDFQVVTGTGELEAGALRIATTGDDGSTLQTAHIGVRAVDFPILRYRFDHFPRTLELSLIFRRDDASAEVQAFTVPWPGDGERTIDLRAFPAWHGQIIELGFAQFATGQLVPASVAFAPFALDGVELSSLSWSGVLAALRTDWFGYTPWALAAVNNLGRGSALPPMLAVPGALLLAIGVAVLAMWRLRRRFWRPLIVAIVAAWLVLDVFWLQNLSAKHALTDTLYARKSWEERERLAPAEDLTFIAEQTRNWLALQHVSSRILVAADTSHNFFRVIYLLLPHNAAALFDMGNAPVPADTLILLFGNNKQWMYDATHGAIFGRGRIYPVEPVYGSGGAQVYRTKSAAP